MVVKQDLQKELVNDIKILLVEPLTSVYSYPEVKEMVSSKNEETNTKLKEIYTMEYLSKTEEHLSRIKSEYENKINDNEFNKPYVVNHCTNTTTPSNSVDIDSLFQTLLVLIGIALIVLFTYNYYATFKLPQYAMQLLGIWGSIITVIYIFTQYIEIMNNGVNSGTECDSVFKQLIEKNVNDLLKKANSNNKNWLKQEDIIQFLNKYFSFSQSTVNSHIKSKKTLEDFLEQQRKFILKSENIGLSHSQSKSNIQDFFDFMIQSNADRSLLIVKDYMKTVSQNKDDLIRKNISEHIPVLTLKKMLLEIESQDMVKSLVKNDKSNDYELYNYLIDKLKRSVSDILYSKNTKASDNSSMKDIIVINTVLKILKIVRLPEYTYLNDHLIYPSTIENSIKELSNLESLNERFISVNSEGESLTAFKLNLLECVSKKSSENAFLVDICRKNQSISNENDRVMKTIDDVITKVVDIESKPMLLNRQLIVFLKKLKNEVLTLNDIRLPKYEAPMNVIAFYYQSKFKYTAISSEHISEYILKIAGAHNDFENGNLRKNYVHNLKNVLKYIQHQTDEVKEHKHVLDDTEQVGFKRHVISFEQYMQKMLLFDKTDLIHLQRKYDIMYNEADNIIENSDKTKDLSSYKKLRVFKVSIILYILTSLLFLSQLIFNKFMKSFFDNKKTEGVSQQGGGIFSSLIEKGTKFATDNMGDLNSKIKNQIEEQTTKLKDKSRDMKDSLKASVKEKMGKKRSEISNIADIDKKTDSLFDVIQISLYLISVWILSIVLLYSYWLKLDSDYTYNEMVRKNNSMRIESTLKVMSTITTELSEVSSDDEKHKTNLLKKLYDQHVILLDLDDKCNMIHPMNGVGGGYNKKTSISFPWNEMSVSILMIGFIVSILIFQTIFNNPFEILENLKHIKRSSTLNRPSEVSQSQSGGAKRTRRSSQTTGPVITQQPGYIQQPIFLENNDKTFVKDFMKEIDLSTLQNSLDKLQQLELRVSSTGQSSITKFSLAGSTFLIATMLSYNIMNNALKYKYELFNGGLFSESRCW